METNRSGKQDFELALHEFSKRISDFTTAFNMEFPEQLLYMLLLEHAPQDVIQRVCLTVPPTDPKPFTQAREIVSNFIKSNKTLKFGTAPMDIDPVYNKGKRKIQGEHKKLKHKEKEHEQ